MLAVVIVLVGFAGAAPVRAAGADDLIEAGIALRKQNRDQEALQLFQQAVQRQTTPRALGQLGLCEHALGLWVAAEKHLQEALRSPSDAWIKKNQATLRDDLDRVEKNVGSIEVWGTPVGAQVSIDGEVAGTFPLPQPIRVAEGRRTIKVEGAGFAPSLQTVTVEPGSLVRAHVKLAALGVPAAPPPPREHPAVSTSQSDPHADSHASVQTTDSRADSGLFQSQPGAPGTAETSGSPFYRRWWFWTAVGAVVIAGAASAFLLTRGQDSCHAPTGAACSPW